MNRIAFPLLLSFLLFTRMSCENPSKQLVVYPAEIELENELIPGPLNEILANKRIIAIGEAVMVSESYISLSRNL